MQGENELPKYRLPGPDKFPPLSQQRKRKHHAWRQNSLTEVANSAEALQIATTAPPRCSKERASTANNDNKPFPKVAKRAEAQQIATKCLVQGGVQSLDHPTLIFM